MKNFEKIIAALNKTGLEDFSKVIALTVGEQKANIAGEIGALSIIVDEAEDAAKKGDFEKASESLDYLSESSKELSEKISEEAVTSEFSGDLDSIIKEIEKFTDNNNTYGAYITMCKKILKDEKLAKAFENLLGIHEYKSYLTPGIKELRNELIEIAENQAKDILSKEEFTKLHASF